MQNLTLTVLYPDEPEYADLPHHLVDGFSPHPAILEWLNHKGSFHVHGHDVMPHMSERINAVPWVRVWEADVPHAGGYVHLVFKVTSGSPIVEITGYKSYGGRKHTAADINRGATYLRITESSHFQQDDVMWFDEIYSGTALNGQGTCVMRAEVDFSEGTVTRAPGLPRHGIYSTPYVPRYATQTGGDWVYFGWRHDVNQHTLDEWRALLYPILSYPGFFRDEDGGWLMAADYPNIVVTAGGHLHQGAEDKGWINYTKDPWWKHRAGVDQNGQEMRSPDDQHFTVLSAVCEVAQAYPDDEGFRMIVKAIGARFPLQISDGPVQHAGSVDRGGARPLLVALDCWRALQNYHEDPEAQSIANALAKRAWYAADTLLTRMAHNDWPWSTFGGVAGRAAVGEAGIVYFALYDLMRLLTQLGVNDTGAMSRIFSAMRVTSKFCFESFKDYPNGFGVPYWRNKDGTDSGSASSMWKFVWMAAVNHLHDDDDAPLKAKILALEPKVEWRWKT